MKTAAAIVRKYMYMLVLLLISNGCVHQWPEPAEADFVLNLEFETDLPQGPVLDMDTKASTAAESYDVRYVVEAYEDKPDGTYADDTPYARFVLTKDDVSDPDHSFKLNIMEGKYLFRVWADYVDAGQEVHKFYNNDNFKYVKLFGRDEGMAHEGNNDFRDAFIGSAEVDVIRFGGHHEPVTETIIMKRPLSKVVFITNDLSDWKTKVIISRYESALQGTKTDSDEEADVSHVVNLDDYVVKVHYPQYMPNAFNIATDRTTWSDANVTFNSKLIQLSEDEASMGFDYVFANNTDANVVMAVSLHDKNGVQLARSRDITVPLERGKVTTVKGSFLLEESDGGVSINPDFDGEFNIIL